MTPDDTDAALDSFRCYHCDGTPSGRELADGWCDSCGKRLPESLAARAKRDRVTPTVPATSPTARGLWTGAVVALLATAGAVAAAFAG